MLGGRTVGGDAGGFVRADLEEHVSTGGQAIPHVRCRVGADISRSGAVDDGEADHRRRIVVAPTGVAIRFLGAVGGVAPVPAFVRVPVGLAVGLAEPELGRGLATPGLAAFVAATPGFTALTPGLSSRLWVCGSPPARPLWVPLLAASGGEHLPALDAIARCG